MVMMIGIGDGIVDHYDCDNADNDEKDDDDDDDDDDDGNSGDDDSDDDDDRDDNNGDDNDDCINLDRDQSVSARKFDVIDEFEAKVCI